LRVPPGSAGDFLREDIHKLIRKWYQVTETHPDFFRANSPKVKICGLTNLEDALVAIKAGADYLGFILYPPSKRAIGERETQRVVAALRAEENCPVLVGVFVNETAEKIDRVLANCHLDLAQLSGDETPDMVADPDSPIYGRSYKALRPRSKEEADAEAEWFLAPGNAGLPSLLVDAYDAHLYGGSGQTADWSVAAHLAKKTTRLMLAGGLSPYNVAAAVRQVSPYAVDVASGVEARPGKKDHALVKAFISSVKRAGLKD
jgi:phosphoribosylanthranilate isomerase